MADEDKNLADKVQDKIYKLTGEDQNTRAGVREAAEGETADPPEAESADPASEDQSTD